jgi:DivIVA domain-containing protein
VTPLPQFQVVGGRVLSSEIDVESAIAADGWFAICAAVAGIVSAVVVFAVVRAARISALVGLTLGGLLASVVAWRVGVALGPGSVREAAAGLKDGASFSGPLRLSAFGVIFAWPLTAVIAYFALAAGLDTSRRADPSTSISSTEGARFPTTMLGPGYDIDEVDSFFARLESGQVTPEEAAHVQFSSTRLSRGYDEEAVDAALDATQGG